MVSKEQFVIGLVDYIDEEVIPVLPTAGKWGLGTIVILGQERYESIVNELLINPYVKMLGIVNDEGLIDIDSLSSALIKTAEKYGKVTFQFPVIGTLSFDENDISNIRKHIIGGGR